MTPRRIASVLAVAGGPCVDVTTTARDRGSTRPSPSREAQPVAHAGDGAWGRPGGPAPRSLSTRVGARIGGAAGRSGAQPRTFRAPAPDVRGREGGAVPDNANYREPPGARPDRPGRAAPDGGPAPRPG